MFGIRNKDRANGAKKKECNVIDLSKAPYMSFGSGSAKGNPKRCLHCHQPIQKGENWRKFTSEDDPEYGRYSVIVHSHCGQNRRVR